MLQIKWTRRNTVVSDEGYIVYISNRDNVYYREGDGQTLRILGEMLTSEDVHLVIWPDPIYIDSRPAVPASIAPAEKELIIKRIIEALDFMKIKYRVER